MFAILEREHDSVTYAQGASRLPINMCGDGLTFADALATCDAQAFTRDAQVLTPLSAAALIALPLAAADEFPQREARARWTEAL